jgi:transposase, IS30 family
LRREHPGAPQWWVSHETIYQAWFVQSKGSLRAELIAELRAEGRLAPDGRVYGHPRLKTAAQRKPRDFRSIDRRGKGRDKTPISERPAEAADRAVPGHWEGDLIIGAGRSGRAAIATVVERASRFTIACLLPETPRTTTYVVARLAETINNLPNLLFRTLTWDNGAEMHGHTQFTVATGVKVYFADPYKPWQRPTNENTNRLIREYLTKDRDLATVTQDELDYVLDRLNSRPRKVLNYQTPAERLHQDHLVATTG